MQFCTFLDMKYQTCCLCFAQFRNLHNLEIAQRILRIRKLHTHLEIAHYGCAISRLHSISAQSRQYLQLHNTFSSLTISSDPILMLRSPHPENSITFPRSKGLSCNCFAGLAAIVSKLLQTKPLKSLPLLIDRQHPQCC